MDNTLQQWLNWQEQFHPKSIDLGLERVAQVWNRLQPEGLNCCIITVGGTNGKGSCVALLESILQAAGFRVGIYTSPHLLRYNERIVVNGISIDDAALCAAFSRINQIRDNVSLTYFEFGTLAALEIFANAHLDVVILEVGLGGRLDAVNIVDADVALVTTVDMDHTEWLGTDRNAIAREKAGIFRQHRPAIIGDVDSPPALLQCASTIGAQILLAGTDFYIQHHGNSWDWYGPNSCITNLPLPSLIGLRQLNNAASVIMALDCLSTILPVTKKALCNGLQTVHLPARLQIISGILTWILDVAHNAQAAHYLAENLANLPHFGRTHAVFACLADKDAANIVRELAAHVDVWHLVQLTGHRSRDVKELAKVVQTETINSLQYSYNSVYAAAVGAMQLAQAGDRILVTGSFVTVAGVLESGLLPIES